MDRVEAGQLRRWKLEDETFLVLKELINPFGEGPNFPWNTVKYLENGCIKHHSYFNIQERSEVIDGKG